MKKSNCLNQFILAIVLLMGALGTLSAQSAEIKGEMKVWYPVSVTIDGPSVDESESTFRNYRLDVTFTKGEQSFKVPGFFAADGNAAETSASSGNKWRAIFTPNEAGTWNYSVSLRTGPDIAISFDPTEGTSATGDGLSGSFTVLPSGPDEPGFFAKGKLIYVGEHYAQFAGNKEWFVRAGPGSPEDFFGYKDFDNTFDWPERRTSTQVRDIYLRELNGEGLHYYTTHEKDWKPGDPTWKGGKGKGIIGALNYLASIGANTLYMIPFTIEDDGDNTWPWTSREDRMSYDVSKLAQWDIVFSHMDKLGIAPLYYLTECDNSKLLDNGDFVLEYPIYYREVIARFGYHLGIRFNLGEELRQTCEEQKVMSKWLKDLDPYNTLIVGHSSHRRENPDDGRRYLPSQMEVFPCLLGWPYYDGPNYQLHQSTNRDHLDIIMWRDLSAEAGRKWVVANDESWGIGATERTEFYERRMLTYAWRTFMAGGEGMVQYCGYKYPEIGDITLENFRLIENTQKILIAAKDLFQKQEINPFLPQMRNENALVGNEGGNDAPFCFAKKGDIYIVYRTSDSNQTPLDLSGETGAFTVQWYDALNGGDFQNGSVTTVVGGRSVDLGNPPVNPSGPWAILVSKGGICAEEKTITVSLAGHPGSTVTGDGQYCITNTVTVTATEAPDAEFINWTENGNIVSTNNPYSFIVTADRNLVANFSKSDAVTYTITTSGNPETSGSTSGGRQYREDLTVTVSANAFDCFKFDNWTENGVVVSTDPNYTFTSSASRNLIANFSTKISRVIAEPAIGGNISGDLEYACGDLVRVSATPNEGYRFDGWYAGDTLISDQLSADINISSDFQLKAKFLPLDK